MNRQDLQTRQASAFNALIAAFAVRGELPRSRKKNPAQWAPDNRNAEWASSSDLPRSPRYDFLKPAGCVERPHPAATLRSAGRRARRSISAVYFST
jgi:hypothetical protein